MKQKTKIKEIRVHTRKVDCAVAKHVAGSNLHRMIKSMYFAKNWRNLAELKKEKTNEDKVN